MHNFAHMAIFFAFGCLFLSEICHAAEAGHQMEPPDKEDQSHEKTVKSYVLNLHEQDNELNVDDHTRLYDTDFHQDDIRKVAAKLETDLAKGLTRAQAKKKLAQHGPNQFRISVRIPYKYILTLFVSPFHVMMWSVAAWCLYKYYRNVSPEFKPYHYFLCAAFLPLLAVAPGAALLYSDYSKSKGWPPFAKFLPAYAKVVRDGELHSVPSCELVPGDIIELVKGDVVPADARVVTSENLWVDFANVVGDSKPRPRSDGCTSDIPVLSENMVFLSCSVTEGKAHCVVTATGFKTFLGRIISLALLVSPVACSFKKAVVSFVNQISIVTVISIAVFLAEVIFSDFHILSEFSPFPILLGSMPEMILLLMALLPFIICMNQYDGLGRLQYTVRNASLVTAAGLVTVFCINKKKILTEDDIRVSQIYFQNELHCYFDTKSMVGIAYRALARAACLSLVTCQRSLSGEECEIPKMYRDSIDNAIYSHFHKFNVDMEMAKEYPKVADVTWEDRPEKCSVHKTIDSNFVVIIRGAYEEILSCCSTTIFENKTIPLTESLKSQIRDMCQSIIKQGETIVAFCDYVLPKMHHDREIDYNQKKFQSSIPWKKLRFVGLLTFENPVAPFVVEAIQNLRNAGIRVIMISDDDEDPLTTLATARKLGIISKEHITHYEENNNMHSSQPQSLVIDSHLQYEAGVYSGMQISHLTTNELQKLLTGVRELVFTKLYPQQKFLIVECLQSLKEEVGYFGHGMSDFTAIKKSNLGITLAHINPSDPANNVADVFIVENKLTLLVVLIKHGRELLENFTKALLFLISPKISQFLPFLIHKACGLPPHMHVWMFVMMDFLILILVIAMLYDEPEYSVMKALPNKHVFSSRKALFIIYGHVGVMQSLAGLMAYHTVMIMYGFYPENIAFTNLIWESMYFNNFKDFYGQEWTFEQRKNLVQKAQSAFFVGALISQIGYLFCMRYRYSSIVSHPLLNKRMTGSIAVIIVLVCFIFGSEFGNTYFGTKSVHLLSLIPSIVVTILIIILDELRKYLVRKNSKGVVRLEWQW